MAETLIGWTPPFRVYRDGGDYWIVDSRGRAVLEANALTLSDMTEYWDLADEIVAELNQNAVCPNIPSSFPAEFETPDQMQRRMVMFHYWVGHDLPENPAEFETPK